MVGFEMFCERCGKRYGNGEASNSGSLPLSKRLLKVVGVSASAPQAPATEPLLRFCLACRGYSCPECWNDDAGFCQTCVPVEEAIADVPTVDIPALEVPSVEQPTPAMAFAEPLAESEGWLDARLESVAAMSVVADGVAEAEPDVAPDPELAFVAEPAIEAEPDVAPEPELAFVAEPAIEAVAEPIEAVEETPEPVLAEAVAEAALIAEVAETLAMDERPIELVFADEEVVEAEPEVAWDWAFITETETETAPAAVEASEPIVEPIAAIADPEPVTQTDGLVEAPLVPARPETFPPPVYQPLPPLGPIVPPPAAASAAPPLAFDVLAAPPAFVIAPPQSQAMIRPSLPAGLFDGPAPQIRPCHQCQLPVSAKARFCRRCGSAQDQSA